MEHRCLCYLKRAIRNKYVLYGSGVCSGPKAIQLNANGIYVGRGAGVDVTSMNGEIDGISVKRSQFSCYNECFSTNSIYLWLMKFVLLYFSRESFKEN